MIYCTQKKCTYLHKHSENHYVFSWLKVGSARQIYHSHKLFARPSVVPDQWRQHLASLLCFTYKQISRTYNSLSDMHLSYYPSRDTKASVQYTTAAYGVG